MIECRSMKQLLNMVESARSKKVVVSDTIVDYDPNNIVSNEDSATQSFFDLVEVCQPFVLMSDSRTPQEIVDDVETFDPKDPIQNAPFKVYSIEMFGDHVSVSVPRVGDRIQVFCDCLLAYETVPMQFMVYAFVHFYDPKTGKVTKRVMLTAAFNDILKQLTDRINSEESGFQQVNVKIKLGTGRDKRFHKIKRVVYVKPKKKPLDEKAESQSRLVNWTQRWFVRGHWRKTDALGKDREGTYCMEGHTWVSEHIKGPEEAPIVRKTRVVAS